MGAGRLLFGRDGDLAILDAAAIDAAEGTGSTAVVSGPAGIGKTALLTEFIARRRDAGDLVLVGRASPDPGAPGYWPWTQILGDAWRSIPAGQAEAELGSSLDVLGAVVPGIVPGGDGPVPEPTAGSAYAVYDAAMLLLAVAAQARPTVIVLDDVHHADAGSWNLLELVVRGAVGSRLLTVVASRVDDEDLAGDRRQQLDRLAAYGRRIELRGLTADDVEAFLATRSPGGVSAEVAQTVSRLSGGNPLFVDELSVVLAGGEDIGDIERHSPSLLLATRRVVTSLGPAKRRLLAAAAVLGVTFDEATVAALVDDGDADPRRIATALAQIAARRLVEADGPGRWRFAHELLREAVLSELADAERSALHQRSADVLGARGPSEHGAGAVAGHLVVVARLGGPVLPAIDQCRRAGSDARSRFAHGEAEHWWSEALDLARRAPDVVDGVRLELLLELGAAQIRAGGAQRARETFQRARTLAGHLDDPVAAARAAIGYADARVRGPGRETELQDLRGDLEAAVTALEGDEADHPLVLVRALGHLAGCLALSSEPEAARVAAQRAADIAARDGSAEAGQAALAALRFVVFDSPSLSERSEATEQLMLLALQANDPETEWTAARWRFLDGLEAGDSTRMLPALATTVRLAERMLDGELQIHALIHTATIALLEGRFDVVAELHAQAYALAEDVDVSLEPILGQDLFASRERGDLDIGGLRLILEARPLPVYRALVCWGSANLGRRDDTEADLDRFFDGDELPDLPADVYLLSILAMLAEAVGFVGDGARAAAVRRRMEPYRDHCVVAGGAGPYVWTGSVHHYLGMLAHTAGDLGAAADHAAAALEVHRRMCASPWVLRTQLLQARIAETEGRTSEARTQLQQVASAAATLSMQAIGAQAEEALQRLGGSRATRGERWCLRPDGSSWTLATPRGEHLLPARKGLRYLWDLLSRPTIEVHAVDLSGAEGGAVDAGGAGPVLDDAAKEAYRRRVEDLRDQIAEGEAWGDDERVARAQAELDAIAHELSAAVGLGGRDRRSADGAERSRINVTRAIRSAIAVIRDHDADVADHLTATVQTGTYCSYRPDPGSGITWQT